MQIAVLVDNNNCVTQFEKGGTVKLFSNENDTWALERQMPYITEGIVLPELLRNRLTQLCDWMSPCSVLAAEKFRGTYRVVLERHSIEMWEMDGFSKTSVYDFLDSIEYFYTQEKLTAHHMDSKPTIETVVPTETKTGYFTIDLTQVMTHQTAFNSKQILIPFFRNTEFAEIAILCDHVPKWFADELPKLKLMTQEEVCGNHIIVKVSPR